jgi:hypothetical protein
VRVARLVVAGAVVVVAGAGSLGAAARAADVVETSAPEPCAEAARVLRAVVAAQQGGAPGSAGAPGRIESAMTPACRDAVARGWWPALAQALVGLAATDPAFAVETCALAPPEAMPAIAAWERAPGRTFAFEAACDVALYRGSPADFRAIVGPRLTVKYGVCQLSRVAANLGARLRPDERAGLLPALEFATRERLEGRDALFRVVCAGEPARSAPACRASATLEPAWAESAHWHRAASGLFLHLGLALAYGLAAVLTWYFLREAALDTFWALLGAAASAVALSVLVMTEPTPGAGPLNALGYGFAAVVSPFVAAGAALVAWAARRLMKIPGVPISLVGMLVYAGCASAYVWREAAGSMCG